MNKIKLPYLRGELLRHGIEEGLTTNEMVCLWHILDFDFTGKGISWPSRETIRGRMKMSDVRSISRLVSNIVDKGFIIRISRDGQSNSYDWTPLVERFSKYLMMTDESGGGNDGGDTGVKGGVTQESTESLQLISLRNHAIETREDASPVLPDTSAIEDSRQNSEQNSNPMNDSNRIPGDTEPIGVEQPKSPPPCSGAPPPLVFPKISSLPENKKFDTVAAQMTKIFLKHGHVVPTQFITGQPRQGVGGTYTALIFNAQFGDMILPMTDYLLACNPGRRFTALEVVRAWENGLPEAWKAGEHYNFDQAMQSKGRPTNGGYASSEWLGVGKDSAQEFEKAWAAIAQAWKDKPMPIPLPQEFKLELRKLNIHITADVLKKLWDFWLKCPSVKYTGAHKWENFLKHIQVIHEYWRHGREAKELFADKQPVAGAPPFKPEYLST